MNERPIGRKNRILAGVLAVAFAGSLAGSAVAAPPPSAQPAAPASAAAKPDLAAAKKHYADAEKRFKAGDYAGALPEFRAANDIKNAPQSERYIGLCEDQLGHLQEATVWYEKFLDHVPEKMAPQGDETRKRVSEIKSLPGKVHIESDPAGASVTIDGKALASATPVETELLPGSHTIHLAAEGRLPTDKQIDVAFASAQTVSAQLDAEPPPAAPPAPPSAPVAATPEPAPTPPAPAEPRSLVPAFVTGGLAVAAAGVGIVFGAIALSDKSNFNKNPTTQTADDGDTHALVSDMAFGVALTFGVTSAVLFLSNEDQPASAPPAAAKTAARNTRLRWKPTPWIGPHSGGAGFALQF